MVQIDHKPTETSVVSDNHPVSYNLFDIYQQYQPNNSSSSIKLWKFAGPLSFRSDTRSDNFAFKCRLESRKMNSLVDIVGKYQINCMKLDG